MARTLKREGRLGTRRFTWLVVPAFFHLTSTILVFLVGRLGLLPGQFDANGIGTSFAPDGIRYHAEAIALVNTLASEGIRTWFETPAQLHVKLYSLSYAAFGPVFGFNILAGEPINAFYYLITLYLVFAIAAKVFDRRTGLLCASIIALWPSFLLHSTQLLRDPLLITLWLVFILVISGWLLTELQWQGGLITAMLATSVSVTLWIVRVDLWILIWTGVVLTAVLLTVRQIRDRQFHLGNSLGVVCLLIALTIIPQVSHALPGRPIDSGGHRLEPVGATHSALQSIIERRRISIVGEPERTSSSVDKTIFFHSTGDVVRYFPRAIEIGFFAPFPLTWLRMGLLTRSTEWLVAGAETLALYIIELTACFTLWRERRRLSVWLLGLISTMGMLGLGLVVVNVGTLYRLRYPFLMLLVIVSANSLKVLLSPKAAREVGIWRLLFRPVASSSLHRHD